MKLIIAYVQPHRLEPIALALHHLAGFPGMTVVPDALGLGPARSERAASREQVSDFAPVARLETVVPDAVAEGVIEALTDAAHTGLPGDGWIFALEVGEAVRIRTRARESEP